MKEALQQRDTAGRRQHNEADDLDFDLEQSSDAEGQGANGSTIAAVKLSSKKKEALSQVPCKFFRSNGCSAGSSCPFAHIGPGEGQGKAVCQWFLKGSCRFGHKCALAHILPGQPMSMDRKNKRAAHHQQQGQNQPHLNGQPQQRTQQRTIQGYQQQSSQSSLHRASTSRAFEVANSMLPGRPDLGDCSLNFMPTFANQQHREGDLLFGVPDDLQAPSVHSHEVTQQIQFGTHRPDWRSQMGIEQGEDHDSYSRHETGFEAIKRNAAPTQAFGTSPFSRPGSQSVFYSNNDVTLKSRDKERSRPIGQSSGRAQESWQGADSSQREGEEYSTVANDVNEEDFLPSSLSDLLTPAELQRRSRGGPIAGLSSSHTFSPHSLPTKTANSSSPWDDSYGQRRLYPPSSLYKEGDASASVIAEDILARQGAKAATSPLPPPLYLQSGNSNLGVSNTSAGFLTSRLRRGLASNQVDDEMDGTKAGQLGAYSPGAHAALSHAPGQSLPQGLASGLSGLHMRPDQARGAEGIGRGGRHQGEFRHLSSLHHNGLMMGGARDELGPTAPSSIFAQKAPLHFGVGQSVGVSSASTSLDALHHNSNHATPLSLSMNGSGQVLSPYAQSPAHRAEGGIAIPSNSDVNELAKSIHHIHSNHKKAVTGQGQFGKQRVRNSGAVVAAGSPITLPTTGEEVEEPIFELE